MTGPALSVEWLVEMLATVEELNPGKTGHGRIGWKAAVAEIRDRIEDAGAQTGARQLAPVSRRDGPPTAHVAAARVEPSRDTRKGKVLAALRSAGGQWVSGVELTTPDTGGSEGARRLRELRDDGWPIENRPDPSSATVWQYRLLEPSHAT